MSDEYIRNAVILRAVDGDTMDVRIDLGFHTFTVQRLRLARINAAEMHALLPEEVALAQRAKVALQFYEGRDCVIQTRKTDIYGRYVAEVNVQPGNINLNDTQLAGGLARAYSGKATKT